MLTIPYWGENLQQLNCHSKKLLKTLKSLSNAINTSLQGGSELPSSLSSLPSAPSLLPTIDAHINAERSSSEASSSTIGINAFRILTDKSFAAIGKAFIRKFPEVPDITKINGFSSFQSQQITLMEDLRSTYDLMAACAEFQETCEAALHQSVHFMTLSLEQNAHLAMLFLDNLVAYCKVAFMVSTLAPEKKILIAAYAKAYSLVVGMQEPTMTRVMKYITAYEKPLGPLQGSFLMLAPKIAALLTSLQPLLEQTVLVQGEKLRQLNYLNIASEITGVNATLHDPMILEILAKHNSLFEIFALGWLMCPMELSKSSKSADLLKHIFTLYGHNLILVGDESIDLTVEYENASRLNTKLARIKISQSEVQSMYQNQAKFHKERRDFVRYILKQCNHLLQHNTFIPGKLQRVCCALGFARDELVWYFANVDGDATSRRRNKQTRQIDTSVAEVLWLLKEIKSRIIYFKDAIQIGVLSQINSIVASSVVDFFETLLYQTEEMRSFHSLVSSLYSTLRCSINNNGAVSNENWKAFTINWLRFQALSSLPSVGYQASLSNSMISDVNLVCELSRWLDDFDGCLNEQSSLQSMVHFTPLLMEHLKETLSINCDYLRYSSCYGWIAEEFTFDTVYAINTQKVTFIQEYGRNVYRLLAQTAVNWLHHYASLTAEWDKQYLPSESQYFHMREAATGNSKKNISSKRVPAKLKPDLSRNIELQKSMDKHKLKAIALLQSLSRVPNLQLFDEIIHVKDFISAEISVSFRQFLKNSVHVKTEKDVAEVSLMDLKRPSIFINEVQSFIAAHTRIEVISDILIVPDLQAVLIEQSDLASVKSSLNVLIESSLIQSKKPPRKPHQATQDISFVAWYIYWYLEFTSRRTQTQTVLTGNRAILQKNQGKLKKEIFADAYEIQCFLSVIGRNGYKQLVEKFGRSLAFFAVSLKDLISQNIEALEKLSTTWKDEPKAYETIKKMKYTKDFIQKCITFDLTHELKSRAHIAAKENASAMTTTVYDCSCCKTWNKTCTFSKRNSSYFGEISSDLFSWENAVRDLSVSDGTSWSLLPYLISSLTLYLVKEETPQYHPYIESFENNYHCLIKACSFISSTILKAITDDAVGAVKQVVKEVTSLLLGHLNGLHRTGDKDLHKTLAAVAMLIKNFDIVGLNTTTKEAFSMWFIARNLCSRRIQADQTSTLKKSAFHISASHGSLYEEDIIF